MVFVLDNYDSFTYNLVQYLGELGQKVEVRRNDQVTPAEVEEMRPSHILVSPGPCTPQQAGISIDLIKHFAGKRPVLGRVPGTSGDWRRFWRKRCPGAPTHARQNQPYPA